MIALYVLGILCLIVLLICLLRLGVLVNYDGSVTVHASIGPVRIQVLPGKEQKDEKTETAEKARPGKEKAAGREKSAFPKPTFADIRSAVTALWPPLKKALGRTRRGIRIDPLKVSLVLGGREDPAAAAENYGYVSAAVWTAMPVLEQLLDIPHPSIHVGTDFEQDAARFNLRAGASIRIGTLLAVALQVGIPALKWYLHFQKQHKRAAEKLTPRTEPAEDRPAA